MLSVVILAAASLAGTESQHLLRGCRTVSEITGHVSRLAAANWTSWNRSILVSTWPKNLEPTAWEPDSRAVVGYRRIGRMIEAKLECGETFLFHPPSSPSGDRLREYSVSHAESTRSEAEAVAQVLRKAVGVPPGAKPAEVICIDCGDPGETLVSGQWVQDDETNVAQIYLRPGIGTWVVQLVWSRRRGA